MADTLPATGRGLGTTALADDEAERALRQLLRSQGSVLVALSGGVDSSLLAALAQQELGARAVAVTGVSQSLPSADLAAVEALCAQLGITHVRVDTHELLRPGYVENSPDRCYHCKSELFDVLGAEAARRGLAVVIEGTTADDLGGHRPGHRAAGERQVLSPYVQLGIAKASVRAIATRLGLPTAQRPASPCLSSRIAYGVEVTPERLQRVERSEAALRALGFSDLRVRLHGPVARIEVPKAQLALAVTHAEAITRTLRQFGFTYVTLDLGGLRSGSLLEVLQ